MAVKIACTYCSQVLDTSGYYLKIFEFLKPTTDIFRPVEESCVCSHECALNFIRELQSKKKIQEKKDEREGINQPTE